MSHSENFLFWWTWCIHNRLPLKQINIGSTLTCCFRISLNIICSSTLCLPRSLCLCSSFPTSILHAFVRHAACQHPSYTLWLDHHKASIQWTEKIMKLLMQFLQAFNFFLLLRLKIKFYCVLRMFYHVMLVIFVACNSNIGGWR